MRSYDSPGSVVTFTIPELLRDQFGSGDENVQIGFLNGITEGPVDPNTGLINVAIEGVFVRTITGEYPLDIGSPVWLLDDKTLGDKDTGLPPFGFLIDAVEAGTATARVKIKN